MHVLKSTYLQPPDVVEQTRPAHLEFLKEEVAAGRLLLAGRQEDGSGGMLIGTVLLNGLGSSLAFLIVGAAFLAPRIPIEERLLSRAFPDEYARYSERVPRLVPRIHFLRRTH